MCGHKVKEALALIKGVIRRFLIAFVFLGDLSMRTLASTGMAWPFFQSLSMASLVEAICSASLCSEQRLPRMLNRIKVCCPLEVLVCDVTLFGQGFTSFRGLSCLMKIISSSQMFRWLRTCTIRL